jgi:cellulose synthase operon protein C
MRFHPAFQRLSVLPLALFALACASPSQEAASAGAAAAQALQAGQLQQAKLAALEAIGHKDDVADYWLLLGRISLELGELGSAYNAYLRASELDRGNAEALLGLARMSLAGGKFDDAWRYADQFLLVEPDNPNAALIKGYVSLGKKAYADALERAEAVLARRPADEPALILKVRALAETTDRAEAIALLSAAVADSGPSRMKLETLIELHEAGSDWQQAKQVYAKLVEIVPDEEVHLEHARFLFRHGFAREGVEIVAPRLGTPASLEYARAVGAGEGRGLSGADLERLASGASEQARLALSSLALDFGHSPSAERIVAPLSRGSMSSVNATAYALLAAARYGQGDRAFAEKLVEQVLTHDATNPRALQVRVQAALDRGDLAEALRRAQLLVRDYPKDLGHRFLLARAYERQQEIVLAGLVYRQAYRDFPGDPLARTRYVQHLTRTGQSASAALIANSKIARPAKSPPQLS